MTRFQDGPVVIYDDEPVNQSGWINGDLHVEIGSGAPITKQTLDIRATAKWPLLRALAKAQGQALIPIDLYTKVADEGSEASIEVIADALANGLYREAIAIYCEFHWERVKEMLVLLGMIRQGAAVIGPPNKEAAGTKRFTVTRESQKIAESRSIAMRDRRLIIGNLSGHVSVRIGRMPDAIDATSGLTIPPGNRVELNVGELWAITDSEHPCEIAVTEVA